MELKSLDSTKKVAEAISINLKPNDLSGDKPIFFLYNPGGHWQVATRKAPVDETKMSGGSMDYKKEYLKYKAKYLRMKKLMN